MGKEREERGKRSYIKERANHIHPTIVISCGNPYFPIHPGATASADQGVFSNIEQIMVW